MYDDEKKLILAIYLVYAWTYVFNMKYHIYMLKYMKTMMKYLRDEAKNHVKYVNANTL